MAPKEAEARLRRRGLAWFRPLDGLREQADGMMSDFMVASGMPLFMLARPTADFSITTEDRLAWERHIEDARQLTIGDAKSKR